MEWTSETGWRPEVNHSLMDIQLLLTELGRVSKSISKMALNFASLLPPGSSRADSQVGSTQCGFCGSVAISVPVALVIYYNAIVGDLHALRSKPLAFFALSCAGSVLPPCLLLLCTS